MTSGISFSPNVNNFTRELETFAVSTAEHMACQTAGAVVGGFIGTYIAGPFGAVPLSSLGSAAGETFAQYIFDGVRSQKDLNVENIISAASAPLVMGALSGCVTPCLISGISPLGKFGVRTGVNLAQGILVRGSVVCFDRRDDTLISFCERVFDPTSLVLDIALGEVGHRIGFESAVASNEELKKQFMLKGVTDVTNRLSHRGVARGVSYLGFSTAKGFTRSLLWKIRGDWRGGIPETGDIALGVLHRMNSDVVVGDSVSVLQGFVQKAAANRPLLAIASLHDDYIDTAKAMLGQRIGQETLGVHTGAKIDISSTPFVRAFSGFGIDRNNVPKAIIQMVQAIQRCTNSGQTIAFIFGQGKRGVGPGPLKPGIIKALLAKEFGGTTPNTLIQVRTGGPRLPKGSQWVRQAFEVPYTKTYYDWVEFDPMQVPEVSRFIRQGRLEQLRNAAERALENRFHELSLPVHARHYTQMVEDVPDQALVEFRKFAPLLYVVEHADQFTQLEKRLLVDSLSGSDLVFVERYIKPLVDANQFLRQGIDEAKFDISFLKKSIGAMKESVKRLERSIESTRSEDIKTELKAKIAERQEKLEIFNKLATFFENER